MSSKYMSEYEMAKILNVSNEKVREVISTMNSIKIGKRLFINKAKVINCLNNGVNTVSNI